MNTPRDTGQNGRRRLSLAIIVPVAVVLGVLIAVVTFSLSGSSSLLRKTSRDDLELLPPIATWTSSPIPPPTSTPTRPATPTRRATVTATNTPRPVPSATATATNTPAATPTETATLPPPTPTPHAVVAGDEVALRAGPMQKYDVVATAHQGETLPVVGRTGDGRWLQLSYDGQLGWVLATELEAAGAVEQAPVVRRTSWPPTPTSGPTRTPRPTPTPRIPRPVLIEPGGGARFGSQMRVRFKFSWYRRLNPDERISIYIRTADSSQAFDWWASEADILGGGGAIHQEGDGVVYEVNSGFGSLPQGSAYWRVAILLDAPDEKAQVSPWSQERRIVIR